MIEAFQFDFMRNALAAGLLAMSYDEEFARIRVVPVKKLYFGLIGMLAVTIVLVIQVVGIILVIALLTIPPFIVEKTPTPWFR